MKYSILTLCSLYYFSATVVCAPKVPSTSFTIKYYMFFSRGLCPIDSSESKKRACKSFEGFKIGANAENIVPIIISKNICVERDIIDKGNVYKWTFYNTSSETITLSNELPMSAAIIVFSRNGEFLSAHSPRFDPEDTKLHRDYLLDINTFKYNFREPAVKFKPKQKLQIYFHSGNSLIHPGSVLIPAIIGNDEAIIAWDKLEIAK